MRLSGLLCPHKMQTGARLEGGEPDVQAQHQGEEGRQYGEQAKGFQPSTMRWQSHGRYRDDDADNDEDSIDNGAWTWSSR